MIISINIKLQPDEPQKVLWLWLKKWHLQPYRYIFCDKIWSTRSEGFITIPTVISLKNILKCNCTCILHCCMVTVLLQLKTLLPCIVWNSIIYCIWPLQLEVMYYWDYRKYFLKDSVSYNLNSRLPLFQGSITSSKYFVINSTGKSSIRLKQSFYL